MQLYHNSRNAKYREPFGAVTLGSEVQLALQVSEATSMCRAEIRIWTEEGGEEIFEMSPIPQADSILFTGKIRVPQTPCLLWYSFIVEDRGETLYYGNRSDQLGGVGEVYSHQPPSYQITVYRDYKIPEWYKNSIAYQIFPDRFHRGRDWCDRTVHCLPKSDPNGPKTILRQNWDDQPSYIKDEEGNVTHWDFFGGTLQGITEKLDYLESLGVGVLYLNPIFQSLSNHRYDTGDYRKIDPRLGDEESFCELCKEAEKRGIFILLDGVFNHTGNDSLYFDAYGNYGGNGAYRNPDSPYADWFCFQNAEKTEYESWWGVKDLPALDKNNPDYQNFIYGSSDSVIRHWLRLGAKGWRLDVADELTDDFIFGIKTAIKETKPDGLLMGEVWEDASNKVSYGKMRKYLLGDELDCVMNYPLRTALIDFLTGQIPSETAGRKLMSLYENYPKPAVEAAFNLIGSHDRARILTLLGTDLDEKRCNADSISSVSGRLDFDLALKRLWVITVLQMTLPGVPCIYYGDEAGLLGGPDPENRGTFPWGKENKNAFTIYRNAIALRKEWRVFTDGNFSVLKTESQDVFAFRRRNDEESVLVFINRSPDHSKTVHVKTNGVLYDLLSAKSYPSERQSIKIELSPCGAAVLREEKKCSPVSTDRACGVLCHITSLPSKWGIGDLGKEAEKFLLKLKQARLSYWQILPINPVDEYDSPYATSSAFAGNPYLISPEDLCARNLITKSALEDAEKKAATLLAKNNRAGIKKIKTELLRNAFSSFRPNDDYRSFCRENSYWLPDYCAFEALKEKYRGKPWQTWPKKYKENTAPLPRELESEAAFYSFCQYMFHLQWKHLLEFSHANGIAIIGDLPFYVSLSSADVWSHRDAFCLDENGYEKVTAGVPPDYFSQDGQVWNNPLYNWRRMEASGFDWWMQRLKQAFARYDLLRLDHFRGFEQYWEIPKGEKSIFGRWKFGPGCKLFQVAKETFGSLPIVAEDLGEITVQVKNLLNACGFLSTDVFQFSYHERLTEKEYLAKKNAVLYSGTHDNQTLKGWLETHHQMLQNSSLSSEEVIRLLYESDAPLVILPLQDLLGLDDNARMNTPGKAENNWKWQFSFSDFTDGTIKKMKDLAENTKR